MNSHASCITLDTIVRCIEDSSVSLFFLLLVIFLCSTTKYFVREFSNSLILPAFTYFGSLGLFPRLFSIVKLQAILELEVATQY